jgi:hypothetical protein
MNWFAIAVVALQVAASMTYMMQNKSSDAAIWFLYAAINLILVFRDRF